MSCILKVRKVKGSRAWWLRLDCGHRYKWTGTRRPKAGQSIDCPEDHPITIEEGVDAAET